MPAAIVAERAVGAIPYDLACALADAVQKEPRPAIPAVALAQRYLAACHGSFKLLGPAGSDAAYRLASPAPDAELEKRNRTLLAAAALSMACKTHMDGACASDVVRRLIKATDVAGVERTTPRTIPEDDTPPARRRMLPRWDAKPPYAATREELFEEAEFALGAALGWRMRPATAVDALALLDPDACIGRAGYCLCQLLQTLGDAGGLSPLEMALLALRARGGLAAEAAAETLAAQLGPERGRAAAARVEAKMPLALRYSSAPPEGW